MLTPADLKALQGTPSKAFAHLRFVRHEYASFGAESPRVREALVVALGRMLAGELEVVGAAELGLEPGAGAERAAWHISMALAVAATAVDEAKREGVLVDATAEDLKGLCLF